MLVLIRKFLEKIPQEGKIALFGAFICLALVIADSVFFSVHFFLAHFIYSSFLSIIMLSAMAIFLVRSVVGAFRFGQEDPHSNFWYASVGIFVWAFLWFSVLHLADASFLQFLTHGLISPVVQTPGLVSLGVSAIAEGLFWAGICMVVLTICFYLFVRGKTPPTALLGKARGGQTQDAPVYVGEEELPTPRSAELSKASPNSESRQQRSVSDVSRSEPEEVILTPSPARQQRSFLDASRSGPEEVALTPSPVRRQHSVSDASRSEPEEVALTPSRTQYRFQALHRVASPRARRSLNLSGINATAASTFIDSAMDALVRASGTHGAPPVKRRVAAPNVLSAASQMQIEELPDGSPAKQGAELRQRSSGTPSLQLEEVDSDKENHGSLVPTLTSSKPHAQ